MKSSASEPGLSILNNVKKNISTVNTNVSQHVNLFTLFSPLSTLECFVFVIWSSVFLFRQKAISLKRLPEAEEVLKVRRQFKTLETPSNTAWLVLEKKAFVSY